MMPMAVLEVPVEEAKAKLKEYQDAVKKEHREVDRRIADGYRHLAQGRQLINLRASILAGGFDERGLPRLAVAGAVWRFVHVGLSTWWGVDEGDRLIFANKRLDDMHSATRAVADNYVGFPLNERRRIKVSDGTRLSQYRAIVPLIPPEHRHHAIRGSFAPFHILFEADWQVNPDAPKDPALIKHLAGDLWAVYAVWDLTELERTVLAGR